MKYILLHSFLGGRKIARIGQTEPVGVCPEVVRWYDERFSLFKTQGNKKQKEFVLLEFLHLILCYLNFVEKI